MIGLFFFEFFVVLRTLEVFLGLDDVMIFKRMENNFFKDYVLDTESMMVKFITTRPTVVKINLLIKLF